MSLVNTLLKFLKKNVERAPQAEVKPSLPLMPVCSVYTKTLGPDYPVSIKELSREGVLIVSPHEIFQMNDYVVLKMVFETRTVSKPGRVVDCQALPTSEGLHSYFVRFRS